MDYEAKKLLCARMDQAYNALDEVIQRLHFLVGGNEIDELLELVREAHDQCDAAREYLRCIKSQEGKPATHIDFGSNNAEKKEV